MPPRSGNRQIQTFPLLHFKKAIFGRLRVLKLLKECKNWLFVIRTWVFRILFFADFQPLDVVSRPCRTRAFCQSFEPMWLQYILTYCKEMVDDRHFSQFSRKWHKLTTYDHWYGIIQILYFNTPIFVSQWKHNLLNESARAYFA